MLVDTCARQHGVLLGGGYASTQTVQWGPHAVSHAVPVMRGHVYAPASDWLRSEIKDLAAVTAAVTAGRVEAFTSQDLNLEGPGKATWASGSRADLWRNVTFAHANPPLDRSFFMSVTFGELFSGKQRQDFCRLLLDIERDELPADVLAALALDDFQLCSLDHLCEFRALCDAVGEKRWRDAFHLWTAIRNGLDYFLTTDKVFLEQLRAGCVRLGVDFELYRPAMSPSELVEILDLPAAPLPFKEGEFVYPYEMLRD